jgi:hypothetical protein
MWVLGGWSNNPSKNWGDVWYSRDGKEWTKLRSNVVWKARHEHSTYVLQDKIWVAGGHAQPLSSEVWSLQVPRDWFEVQPEPKSSTRSTGQAASGSQRGDTSARRVDDVSHPGPISRDAIRDVLQD